jgi:hypothetical protein
MSKFKVGDSVIFTTASGLPLHHGVVVHEADDYIAIQLEYGSIYKCLSNRLEHESDIVALARATEEENA